MREKGVLQVWMTESGLRTLLRATPDSRGPLTDTERVSIAEHEAKQFAAWSDAKKPLARSAPNATANEDRWLDTQERLEEFLATDPGHLGAIRDDLVADCELLAREGSGPLSLDLIASAAMRLRALESVRDPDASDAALAARVRTRLFLTAQIYPAAVRAAEADATALTGTLRPLGEGSYRALDPIRAGSKTISVWQNGGTAPAGLLWGETWFVSIPARGEALESTAAVVLAQRDGRWYLLVRHLDRSELAAVFGSARPSDDDVRTRASTLLR